MSDEPAELNGDEQNDPQDADWKNRTLCSDESCIGVIGPDGHCKECGRPYEQPQDQAFNDDQKDSQPNDDDVEPTLSDSDDDWENRTLCSDESCIGVIGPDGRCKECGKPYAG